MIEKLDKEYFQHDHVYDTEHAVQCAIDKINEIINYLNSKEEVSFTVKTEEFNPDTCPTCNKVKEVLGL